MSLSFIIFRIISGSVLLIVAFVFANNAFDKNALFKVPYLAQTLAAFLAGAAGLYVIPFLVVRLSQIVVKWLTSLIQVTVQTTVARSMGSFFSAQAGRLRRGRAAEFPVDLSGMIEETSPVSKERILLDTSGIIDGRIFDIARSGFLSGELVATTFVVRELQGLADSSDPLKRQRGRRGLNLLDEAKKDQTISLSVWDGEVAGADVDMKLTKLAKKMKSKIATVDYNLNKAASLSEITVLNVNELVNLVKTVVLPGEKIKIKVIHPGKEPTQGVGYLSDGTMIVVENGAGLIGREVEVEVNRLLQTSAGKMIFAKPL